MPTNKAISEIRRELRKNTDPEYKRGEIRFFKEKIKTYGVRSADSKRISREYFVKIKHLPKQEIFSLCEELMKSGYIQEIGIASKWAFRLKNQYQKKDFRDGLKNTFPIGQIAMIFVLTLLAL